MDRLPVVIVALGMALALWATGVLDLGQALGGLGDPTVIFIASLFVVSAALEATGVTAKGDMCALISGDHCSESCGVRSQVDKGGGLIAVHAVWYRITPRSGWCRIRTAGVRERRSTWDGQRIHELWWGWGWQW
jgi:hypothetical protein